MSMPDAFAFMLGFAQATVLGLLLVSGAGKLAACSRKQRRACLKGGADLALGAGIFAGAAVVAHAAAVLTIAVVAFGWLRERRHPKAPCNCFGVLGGMLEPRRHVIRAGLALGALATLALYAMAAPGAPGPHWLGAFMGLALVLLAMAFAFARRPAHPGAAVAVAPVLSLPENTVSMATTIGTRADGSNVRLGDLMRPGLPLALLITAPTCAACQTVKAELGGVLDGLSFPLQAVEERPAGEQERSGAVLDPQRRLRALLGVRTIPSLVIVDAGASNLAFPVAMGPQAIYGRLLACQLSYKESHQQA